MIILLYQEPIAIPTAVYVIWAITLAVAILVVLPLTVLLLQRTYKATRNIERYMGDMRDAGVGITRNTSHIKALDDTIEVATQILDTAGSIKEHSAAIETTLVDRVDGRVGGGQ
ncbi:MAG TPA: hypothetical protein VF177_20945 [Anaerolineae bacterium]